MTTDGHREELINAIARSDRGLTPPALMQIQKVDALYEHESALQADLEALVRDGELSCHESPGTHRYRIARTGQPRSVGRGTKRLVTAACRDGST